MSVSDYRWKPLLTCLATIASLGLCAAGALAQPPGTRITSAGPLSTVGSTPDLNCYVNHVLDSFSEFFGTTACGTFVASEGHLYGPREVPAGPYYYSELPEDQQPYPGYLDWRPVEQSGVTGSGSSGDPYRITTKVQRGPFSVTQVDRYVVGEESFRTDVTVSNTSGESKNVVIYRAGDCYLGNSDYGYGRVDGDAITCLGALSDGSPGTRIEQFLPITAGSNYYQAGYSQVWSALLSQKPLPDTCRCSEYIDNGAGLSWTRTVPAGGQVTVSSIITFSPAGNSPLTIRKTVDRDTAAAGEAVGYTVRVENPNIREVTLSSLTDTLPAGAAYLAGSTTGDITADPISAGGTSIRWNGPFVVPANGVFTLHYAIRAPESPGTYSNSVVGEAAGFTVVPAEDVDPVDVTPAPQEPTIDLSKIADDPLAGPGAKDGYWITVSNPNATPVTLAEVIDRLPAGFHYIPGSSSSLTTSDPQISGQELTWDEHDLVIPPHSAVKLHFGVTTALDPGIDTDTATARLSSPAADAVSEAKLEAPVHVVVDTTPLALRLHVPARVTRGSTLPITLTVSNDSKEVAHGVHACARLPRGLALAPPRRGRLVCFTAAKLGENEVAHYDARATALLQGPAPVQATATARNREPARGGASTLVLAGQVPRFTG